MLSDWAVTVRDVSRLVDLRGIAKKIHLLRGHRVMLSPDLAALYAVDTRELHQAVKRNLERFPEDFMFQLEKREFENLRSQIVISSWGGSRYTPFAFTEQGVAMVSCPQKQASHRSKHRNHAGIRAATSDAGRKCRACAKVGGA